MSIFGQHYHRMIKMLEVYCRASILRSAKAYCIACGKKIRKGKLYMRFIPRFMANEPLHIECYAYDNPKEPFAVAVDYKRYWCANFIVIKLETLNENIKEILTYKTIPQRGKQD